MKKNDAVFRQLEFPVTGFFTGEQLTIWVMQDVDEYEYKQLINCYWNCIDLEWCRELEGLYGKILEAAMMEFSELGYEYDALEVAAFAVEIPDEICEEAENE